MKKSILPILGVMAGLLLVGCNENNSASKAASSKQNTSSKKSTASTSKSSSSKSSVSVSVAPAETWTKTKTEKNSDDKDNNYYTSSLGRTAVGIALGDCVSTDAGNIGNDGKIKLNSTTHWKIKAPKAGQVTMMMSAKLSAALINDNATQTVFTAEGYAIAAGETAGTVTLGGKGYVTDFELSDTESKYYEVGTLTVVEGENTISFTVPSQQYYRLCNDQEVRLVYAAAK